MKTEITSSIHYVGVNDRHKTLFEGLWPLPYGVSYNSYIILDDKIALVDTVEVDFFPQFLDNIRRVIGDRQINYIIVNHVEPDHSGSIALIKKYYPEAVIVGNKKTFDMLSGYYGVGKAGDILEVKQGDTLSLGHHELAFTMVPMVHWPETMVTLDTTAATLFSGDAFGCFGALSGAVIDEDMCCDIFWDEMRRYYSNIVGKYGVQVQQALKKLAGVKLDYICSTHGPVWHQHIDRVVSMYDVMSRYEAEQGLVVCYGSMYGNTERAAEMIAAAASEAGVKNIVMHDVSRENHSFIIRDIFRYKAIALGAQQRDLSADGIIALRACRTQPQGPLPLCLRLVHMGRSDREEDSRIQRGEAEAGACGQHRGDKAEPQRGNSPAMRAARQGGSEETG